MVMVLVGNKTDKASEEREVSYLEASRFAQEQGMYIVRRLLDENKS
jgi:Ras-related protein Rab-4B